METRPKESLLTIIAICSFGIMPIVDSFNGAFQQSHIADIYRLFLTIYVFFFLFFGKKIIFEQSLQMLLVVFFFGTLIMLQYFFLYGYHVPLVKDLKSLMRILLTIIFYAYFYKLIQLKLITKEQLKDMLLLIALGYSACIILPFLFGKGLATYDIFGSGTLSADQGVGFKAYFLEVNSLSAILIGLVTLCGEECLASIKQNSYRYTILVGILFLGIWLSLLLTSTKTSLVYGIFYFILFVGRMLLSKKLRMIFKLYGIFSINLIFLLLKSLFLPKFVESVNGVLARGFYFFDLMDGNWIQFLTSNRSVWLVLNWQQLLSSKHFLFIHFFGAGYYINVDFPLARRILAEMDLFDFYFSYGLVGYLLYISYFKTSLIHFYKAEKDSVSWMFLTLFIYSIFAGHVFVNAMAATLLAIIFAYFTARQESSE
ncbi:hypothetical protein RV11_GL003199 [Enterococcus phoeniculicola]|nr:hypothetical protein RV11_GL003199 [Enterococcus phoeniculicola]